MGRPETPLRRDGSPVRELAFWLRALRNEAGLTYEQLARRSGYATSTLQEALAGRRLPTLPVVLAVARACDGDEALWRDYWSQVCRNQDPDAPPGLLPAALPAAALPPSVQPPAARPGDGEGWHVERTEAELRLDLGSPEAVEERTVVAEVDGLAEITTSVSVPRREGDASDEHGLHVELLGGGRLERREQPYESYFRQVLVLPRPLRAGERHVYTLRLRLPARQPMAPHYVHVPLQRSDAFHLRVRFDPARPPRSVWRIDGAPTAVIYERGGGAQPVPVAADGLATAEFHAMRVGLSYGLRWQDEPPPAPDR